jgi:hypothetical protein
MERVLNHSRTRGTDRGVLMVVAWHVRDDGSGCTAGLHRLADEAAYDPGTVVRALARIRSLGELHRDHRGGRGARDTSTYSVTIAHEPGSVARCTTSCRREVLQRAGGSIAARRDKYGAPPHEPSGTVREPLLDAPPVRRRAAKTVGPKPKAPDRPPPDPRIATLLCLFCTTHEQALGTRYLVEGGRDGARLKHALATYDEPTVRRAIVAYFADPDARRRFRCDLPDLVRHIAVLTSRREAARPEPEDRTGIGQARAAARAGGHSEGPR